MARLTAMMRRALSTCRFSIIRPFTVATPRPEANASSQTATMFLASSSATSVGANARLQGSTCPGWINVLPSKPSCRPCRHSASNPSRSRMSLKTPSRMATPAARAASRHNPSPGSSGARPGTCSACSSLARSLVPITRTASRCEARAISSACSIATGVSTIAQIMVRSGAPAAWRLFSTACTSWAQEIFGTTTASGPAAAAARRSSACQRVSRALTRMVTSRPP